MKAKVNEIKMTSLSNGIDVAVQLVCMVAFIATTNVGEPS